MKKKFPYIIILVIIVLFGLLGEIFQDRPSNASNTKKISALEIEQDAIRETAFEKFRDMFEKPEVSFSTTTFDYYAKAPAYAGYTVIATSTIEGHSVAYAIPRAYRYIDDNTDNKQWKHEDTAILVDDKEVYRSHVDRFIGLAHLNASGVTGDVLLAHSMGSCDCGNMTFVFPSEKGVAVVNYNQAYMHDDAVIGSEDYFIVNNILTDQSGNIYVAVLENPSFEFKGAMLNSQTTSVPLLSKLNTETGKFETYSNDSIRKIYTELSERMSKALKKYRLPDDYVDEPVFTYTNILGFQEQLKRLAIEK